MKTAVRTMKLLAAGLLCLLMLISVLAPALAAAPSGRTVRVGYVWSTNFSEGESDEEYKSGYAYEYLQKLAYYTGWSYEYVYGDWSTILEMLSRGEVDVMAGISYTEERARVMSFPNYPMGYEAYYIYVWQNSELAGLDASQLKGLTIGATEGSMQHLFLTQWNRAAGYPCTVQTFGGNTELYRAFSSHAIDAVVDTDTAILPTDGLVPLAKVGSSDYYLAVAKGQEALLAELNVALEKLDRTEPYYLQSLHQKYFSETAVGTTLTAAEKTWLAGHPAIRVGYMDDYMPFCATDENGEATGLVADLFSALFEQLTMETRPTVVYVPFADQKELMAAVSAGTVDVAFPIYGDAWFSESQGVFQTSDIAKIMVDLVFQGDYSDLNIRKIGVNRNNLIQYQFTVKQFPGAEIILYDSIDSCLEAIVRGEIDCTITNGLRTNPLTGKSYYDSLSYFELSDSFALSMGVKRGEVGLLTLLNRGLNTLDKNFALSSAYKYQKSAYTYTAKDFLRDNIAWIIFLILLFSVIFAYFLIRDIQRTRGYLAQERALTRNLEEALSAARSANQAKTAFLNNMSHDIRTPMNAIIGFTNIAKKQNTNQEVGSCLEKISSSSEHLLTLINDVLDISRVESGKTAYTPVPTNLCAVTEAVENIAQGFLSNRHLTFRVERPQQAGHCCVLADPVRVREVLVNILSNAVKFTDDGGTIVFSMGSRPGADENHITVWFSVSDTGCGMSEEFLPHVFDEFSQEESSARTQYKGTGLGMAITRHYVDLMGGTITVRSRKGQGTTFTVELPLALIPPEQVPSCDSAAPEADLTGVKVLMAEDNDLNAEIATVQLEELGMQVTRAVNGKAAVELFAGKPEGAFDLILMDIMMPEMDGYQASRAIRAMEDRPDGRTIPIIAMTANAFAEDVQASLEAGMNAHVAKPIVMEELLKTIARNLKH